MGTAEIESALVLHEKIAEAAIVGFEHPIKGQGIYAFITLMSGEVFYDGFEQELRNFVATEIGPIAKPDLIQNAPGLLRHDPVKLCEGFSEKLQQEISKN